MLKIVILCIVLMLSGNVMSDYERIFNGTWKSTENTATMKDGNLSISLIFDKEDGKYTCDETMYIVKHGKPWKDNEINAAIPIVFKVDNHTSFKKTGYLFNWGHGDGVVDGVISFENFPRNFVDQIKTGNYLKFTSGPKVSKFWLKRADNAVSTAMNYCKNN